MLRPIGFASILVLLCASLSVAQNWPPSPINPKSKAECYASYNGYRAIWAEFDQLAKGFDCVSIWASGASMAKYNACARERRQASERAIEALRRGSQVRNACLTEVRESERLDKLKEFDGDYEALAAADAAETVGGRLLGIARNEAMMRADKKSAGFAAFRASLGTAIKVHNRISLLASPMTPQEMFDQDPTLGLRSLRKPAPLSSLGLDIATLLAGNLGETALAEFNAGMREFETSELSRSTLSRLNALSRRLNAASSSDTSADFVGNQTRYNDFDRRRQELVGAAREYSSIATVRSQASRELSNSGDWEEFRDRCDSLHEQYIYHPPNCSAYYEARRMGCVRANIDLLDC